MRPAGAHADWTRILTLARAAAIASATHLLPSCKVMTGTREGKAFPCGRALPVSPDPFCGAAAPQRPARGTRQRACQPRQATPCWSRASRSVRSSQPRIFAEISETGFQVPIHSSVHVELFLGDLADILLEQECKGREAGRRPLTTTIFQNALGI